jgi:hypothetical protein
VRSSSLLDTPSATTVGGIRRPILEGVIAKKLGERREFAVTAEEAQT